MAALVVTSGLISCSPRGRLIAVGDDGVWYMGRARFATADVRREHRYVWIGAAQSESILERIFGGDDDTLRGVELYLRFPDEPAASCRVPVDCEAVLQLSTPISRFVVDDATGALDLRRDGGGGELTIDGSLVFRVARPGGTWRSRVWTIRVERVRVGGADPSFGISAAFARSSQALQRWRDEDFSE